MANVRYQSYKPAAPNPETLIKTTGNDVDGHVQHVNIDTAIPAGDNNIGNVDIVTIPDPYLEFARGNVTGGGVLNKFGRNPDIDTGGTPETIWDYGGLWVGPTAARTHALVSASSADEITTGTGAWTVSVQGLNAAYAVTTESVNLTGTVAVNTVNSYVIIYRMIVTAAGTTGANIGAITATAAAPDSTVTASIAIGNNQTLMAVYQVAAGKTLYLTGYYFSANSITAAAVTARLWVKPFGQVWQLKHIQVAQTTGASYVRHQFIPPLAVSEKSLIRMSAASSANNADVSGGFDGVTI